MRALAALTPAQLIARAAAKVAEDAEWEARIAASEEERHRLAKAFLAEKAARDAKEHAKWAVAKARRTGHIDVCRFHILLRRAQAEHAAKGDACLKSLLHYQGPRGDARTITVADALEGCYSKAKGNKCPFVHEESEESEPVAIPAPVAVTVTVTVPDLQFRQFDLGPRVAAATFPVRESVRDNACRQPPRQSNRGGGGATRHGGAGRAPTPPPAPRPAPRPAPAAPVDPLAWLKEQQRTEAARISALTPEQWRAEQAAKQAEAAKEGKRAEMAHEALESLRGTGRNAEKRGLVYENDMTYRGKDAGFEILENTQQFKTAMQESMDAFTAALQGPQAANASYISVGEGSRREAKILAAKQERERNSLINAAVARYNALTSSSSFGEIAEAVRQCRLLGVATPEMIRREREANFQYHHA
jgi:hypothetical protein